MRRRILLTSSTSAALVLSGPSKAQQKPTPIVGSLNGSSAGPYDVQLASALLRGLGETGFVEGRNVAMEYLWADGDYDRLPALAVDFVRRKVDVITVGSLPGATAAKTATSTIPIVFALAADPVEAGLVTSLGRPGGNLTGISILNVELVPKRFDLLFQLVPRAKTIALLVNPGNANAGRMVRDTRDVARQKAVGVEILNASSADQIDSAFETLIQRQVGGLVVGTDPFLGSRRDQLAALASRHGIPTIFGFPTAGALISYGTNLMDVYRRVGIYVGRILMGAKPADLPVLQAIAFELVVNLNAARSLGITVPPSLLLSATEVID